MNHNKFETNYDHYLNKQKQVALEEMFKNMSDDEITDMANNLYINQPDYAQILFCFKELDRRKIANQSLSQLDIIEQRNAQDLDFYYQIFPEDLPIEK